MRAGRPRVRRSGRCPPIHKIAIFPGGRAGAVPLTAPRSPLPQLRPPLPACPEPVPSLPRPAPGLPRHPHPPPASPLGFTRPRRHGPSRIIERPLSTDFSPQTDLSMEPRIAHNITVVPNSAMVQPLLDRGIPYGRLQHPLTILPIDQMKTSHVENDYTDNPGACQAPKRPRAPQEPQGSSQHPQRCEQDVTHPWISFSGRPSSISSSSSTSSDQRLLDHMAPVPVAEQSSPRAVRIQPKAISCKPLELKGPACQEPDKHFLLCEACGKCKCKECSLPRTLPSCWVCKQECLCSAQNLVNYSTCMCLVKGVFYHCTNEDDEGTCADHPCSCSQSNCCARWSFMGALSLVLPCLLCYLPATGCVKLAQGCYDRVSRPGCRCKNTNSVICKALPEGKGAEKPF